MSIEPEPDQESVTLRAVLSIGGETVMTNVTVPTRPVPLADFLSLLRSLADLVVDRSAGVEAAEGRAVSCRKGCGACCRQLVPISEVEARAIRRLVDRLPEPRRSQTRARFAEARRRLEAAGLLDELLRLDDLTDDLPRRRGLGLRYFAQGIPCPFLEDESCSIHPDRPVLCREFLVTSPAENCDPFSREVVRRVPLAAEVSSAVERVGKAAAPGFTRRVPLSLALEWAESHPDESPRRPGLDWLREVFDALFGHDVPPPPG